MLPNFNHEQITDWIVCDRFRFEREDVVKVWTEEGLTFYKLVFSEFSSIREKIVVFKGDTRVGYVSWTEGYEIHGLYVMPDYRSRGIGKKLLSFVPKGLNVWVMDFTLTHSEPQGLPYDKLTEFYQVHYFDVVNTKENIANEKSQSFC